jgi:hypothetical protein
VNSWLIDEDYTLIGFVSAVLVNLSLVKGLGQLTESSSQAAIKASYGLLNAEVEIPLRSSNVLLVWTGMSFGSDMLLVGCG